MGKYLPGPKEYAKNTRINKRPAIEKSAIEKHISTIFVNEQNFWISSCTIYIHKESELFTNAKESVDGLLFNNCPIKLSHTSSGINNIFQYILYMY